MKSTVIAISNQKGGVAKTTSTAAIAAVLATMGNKVLVIDLDSQGSLSSLYLSTIPEETVADLLNDGIYPIVKVSELIDLIPCNTDISAVAAAMNEPNDRLLLKAALDKIRGNYDFILLDCPPAFNYITNNAYTAADYVFVPCNTSKSNKSAIMQIAEACMMAATPTRINGIFFTMYDGRPKINRKVEAEIRDRYPDLVLQTVIRRGVKVEEALDQHKDIVTYAPSSNPAIDYKELVNEILIIIGK